MDGARSGLPPKADVPSRGRLVRLVPAADIGDRQAIILATNQTLDSMDEIVMTSGAKTGNFRKRGGPILRDHDSTRPIARALTDTVGTNGLQLLIQFPPEGASVDSDEAYRLMKADILRGVSIGLNPVRAEPMDPKRPYGPQRHLEWELIEVSLVAVPANPDARVLAKARAHASLVPENLRDRDEMGKRLNEVMRRAGLPPAVSPSGRPSDTERRAWRVAELQRQHTDHLLNQPRYRHL